MISPSGQTIGDQDPPTLIYDFKNTRPIELADLASSLLSLGDQYRSFVARRAPGFSLDDLRLYVKEVRTGSVVAELISAATQNTLLLPFAPLITQYVAELGEWFEFFKGVKDAADIKDLLLGTSKKDLQQISAIVEPVAKDRGSQFNIVAQQGGTIINHFVLTSVEANAGQQQLRRLLELQPAPESGIHRDQVLYWYQVRDDQATKPGDKAVIERFSARPVRVRFASDQVKAAMLERPDNPFRKFFVVDVDVTFVAGKPVLYRILEVVDTINRDEE